MVIEDIVFLGVFKFVCFFERVFFNFGNDVG